MNGKRGEEPDYDCAPVSHNLNDAGDNDSNECPPAESQGFQLTMDISESQGFSVDGDTEIMSPRDKRRETRRVKERPSAMEIMESASSSRTGTRSKKVPEKEDSKKSGRESSPYDLEFRVASPNLTKLINDNGSDSSSPVSSLMLAQTIVHRSETSSPLLEAPLAEVAPVDMMDLGLGPMETNLILDDLLLPGDGTTEAESSRDVEAFVDTPPETLTFPGSPQKARRGRGRSRGRLARGGRGRENTRPVLVRESNTSTDSMTDSLPDLVPMDSNPVDRAKSATTFAECSYTTAVGKKVGKSTLTSSQRAKAKKRGKSRARVWTSIKRRNRPVVKGNAPVVKGNAPVVKGNAPVVKGNAPVVKGNAPGVESEATVVHGNAAAVKDDATEEPMDMPNTEESDDGPQYEGVSPSGHRSPTPCETPLKMEDTTENTGMLDVAKRMEEIQSLVSDIQKESSQSNEEESKPPKKIVSKPRRKSCSSKPSSPRALATPPRGDLKMTIKLGEKNSKRRGNKRKGYTEDGEYQPTSCKKPKLDPQQPKRSSGRKSEHDLFLDRYKYLTSYSDDSRSPSPLRHTVPTEFDSKAKAESAQCRVHVFDFVKCFNIKNMSDLNDLNYNKHIRRQIRAMEKGHQVARLKASTQATAQAVVNETDGSTTERPSLVAGSDAQLKKPLTPPVALFIDHLDDIFDDVLTVGKKKRRKKRQKSGAENDTAPGVDVTPAAATPTTPPQAVLLDSVATTPDEKASPVQNTVMKKQFKCRQCTFFTADLPCIQEHINLHEEPYHCSECPAIFPQISRALEHTISAHPNTPARVVRAPDFNPNDHFDEAFQSSSQNTQDVPEEKETNYQCQLCSFRTDDRQEIESHLQTNHKAEYQYVCKICDLAFCRKRETMLKHFKKWHPDQPLDFTAAPGVEDKGPNTEPATSDEVTANKNDAPSRPASVISIASEASIDDIIVQEKRTITSAADSDDVLVIESSTVTSEEAETPVVLRAETRSCTYKCLECGAKTDTFDVICAHLEVSHPDTDYSFSCPFCDDYKAKTCSFVAEHIRTAHPEFSGRCMERNLEKANSYVKREFTGPSSASTGGTRKGAPPRIDSARSSNQENRSPDDEVMILDVATSQAARQPFQPLSLVHHSQEPLQRPLPPPSEMIQIFPDYSITKAEYERYQVFNLKPLRITNAPPSAPLPVPRPIRPPPPVHSLSLSQPAQIRPSQSRPMPTLQPRPFIPATSFYPQMQVQRTTVPVSAPSLQLPASINNYPHLLQMMHHVMPTNIAQPIPFNGAHNQPR